MQRCRQGMLRYEPGDTLRHGLVQLKKSKRGVKQDVQSTTPKSCVCLPVAVSLCSYLLGHIHKRKPASSEPIVQPSCVLSLDHGLSSENASFSTRLATEGQSRCDTIMNFGFYTCTVCITARCLLECCPTIRNRQAFYAKSTVHFLVMIPYL